MLTVEKVWAGYGSIKVLNGVSLEVKAGELVCLLGPNGAGKSTLLKAIGGFLATIEGVVRFEAQNLRGLAPELIVKLGISQVLEGRQIFGGLSVLDNLVLGGYVRRDDAAARRTERIERAFHLFPILRERQKQMAGSLSGGEQQMLAIGRALMSGPRLLILDEPSFGLAPLMVRRIMDVLNALRKEGVTVLLAEQQAQESLRIADRGYVMERGQIVLAGSASDLREHQGVKEAYLGDEVSENRRIEA